jgi:hypothetical protein
LRSREGRTRGPEPSTRLALRGDRLDVAMLSEDCPDQWGDDHHDHPEREECIESDYQSHFMVLSN